MRYKCLELGTWRAEDPVLFKQSDPGKVNVTLLFLPFVRPSADRARAVPSLKGSSHLTLSSQTDTPGKMLHHFSGCHT